MKRKIFIYEFVVGLVCLISILTFQPLSSQASSVVLDEIEQSVNQEEIHSIEKPSQQETSDQIHQIPSDEQQNSEDKLNDTSTQDSLTEEQPTEEQEATEESAQEDSSEKIQQVNKPTKPSEKQPISHKKQKRHFIQISKIFDKISSLFHKIPHTLVQSSHNKHNKKEQIQNHIYTHDFAPYYFINPSIENNYLEKIVYPDKITNAAEFLPYSLTIRKMDFKINPPKNAVTPQGIDDISVLINAPSPQIEVLGKRKFAKLVIDIRNNTLYKYDKEGFPLKAYLVATGARGTRTMAGLRIVTYKEKFPYSGAPESKRALDPYSYGPYIIFLNKVDPKTGRQCCVEQLLHGNGNEYSIGRKVSHGCIRTNNNVMRKELSKEVVRGDYILLINPDIE